jgi:2-oxoglutarate ferredoxin oxidoreductase subunit alpha
VSKINEVSLRISGRNGDGIFSAGGTLAKILSRSSLNVHGSRTYQSIIRGGHVSYSLRAANHTVKNVADYIDVLIALRLESFTVDSEKFLRSGSIVLYDAKGSRIIDPDVPEGVILLDMPALEIAKQFTDMAIVRNTVFVGASLFLYGLDIDIYLELLTETFGEKKQEIININLEAAKAGYEWAKTNTQAINHNIQYTRTKDNIYIGGNEVLAFGMLNGGLQSFSFYPMTPATPVGTFLAKFGPLSGCVVKQMEDEVNVANYAVGAGIAGARSACATSGGGFALMTEAIGFAGMAEAPVVFIEVARGGPSTGLPTKTEQGDLNQLLGASQGDFPRAIIAQIGVEEGFYLGQEALDIAEKYQMPVLIASDLYMGEHFETVKNLDYDRTPIERGKMVLDEIPEDQQPFKRYLLTDDGVSPRTIPGVKGGIHDASSDEHDEFGYLVSDRRAGFPEAIEVRNQQMHKRMKKMDMLLKELPAPKVEGYSSDEAQMLVVAWGSSYELVKEVRKRFDKNGVKMAHLHIKYIMPFHAKEVEAILKEYESKGVKIVMVEGNYTGQMARLIRAETGFEIKQKYLRFDGEYILPRELEVGLKEML